MLNWKSVEIPGKLASRPKDGRGFPIPANVLVDQSGKPDFRVPDADKWVSLVNSRCCGLCGQPLGRHLAFIGGPMSYKSRLFTDLPMHKECATYAIQVCPFLAAPNFRYAEKIAEKEGYTLEVNDQVSTNRPETFFLGTTKGFNVVQVGPDIALQATPWETTDWWSHGERSAAP